MYRAIAANKRNTVMIMAVFVAIITGIGWIISYYYNDTYITYWVLIGAIVYTLIQYFAAGDLAVSMTGAKEIQKSDNPRLYRIVENLAITTGMPMPKVYIINDSAPNAFATGRDPKHAIVAATTGLIDIMDDRELEAVMAHEMGHVKNYDIRVSMIAFGLVSVISVLSDVALRAFFYGGDNRKGNANPVILVVGLILIIIAPFIASMVQLAVGRQREYLADATGSLTTRDSQGLISALGKLRDYGKPMKQQHSATAHMFISNPLKPSFMSKLLSTHPPIEDRIKRLQERGEKF